MDDTEFDYDAEASESGTLAAAEKRVQKLKAELGACKAERQEYLDGWQRLRADVANQKKEGAALFERAAQGAVEQVLEEMLPSLDAFDMARGAPSWGTVDPAWRGGMEHVHTQLLDAFKRRGIEAYGEAGEEFDAALHEALGEEKSDAPAHTIVRVVRKGYRLGTRVLRPAQVIIAAET